MERLESNTFDKLLYLLRHYKYDIDLLVDYVLNDSNDDPDYSAVTTSNLITCYIQVMNELNQKVPYTTVKDYIINLGYSEEDYNLFDKKKQIESKYYIGEQF